ncbi:MAG TPA: hypothetical protein VGK23_06070 [Methanomassiliicoccales archaeon]|jgi:hypothetical protein
MTDGNRRFNSSGISTAAVLLSVAVAIVVSFALNNWWLLVPVILLELGVFVLILGFSLGKPAQGMPWTKSDSNYFLFWGNLMAMIGVVLIINTFFPGYVVILIVVLLVWFAVVALLFSLRRRQA